MATFNRQLRREMDTSELDVTAFMNLMIVLVPVLLLSLVFTHTTIIDLNFPSGGQSGAIDPKEVHLEIRVEPDALVVADGHSIIKRLPRLADGGEDFTRLSAVLREIKRRLPEKRDATILLTPDTPYQTLVSVMDRVRSYPAVMDGKAVRAELFPEVSLGDAPKERKS